MESMVPPSYEEATTRDYWLIVAQYIPSPDLCAASLVCRRWNEIFGPCLWGNPASHFGTENDRVYVALTRFKRTLPRARLRVRQLTHTLHLPPAQSELYDGPHPEWLRDVLEHLPNLQSLVVSELPFFDHSALLALRRSAPEQPSTSRPITFTFHLRLLIAAYCSNTTSASLAGALLLWPNLVFLDLSNTLAARDHSVLATFQCMHGLQVLKLRHVHLRDDDIEVLAPAIGIRVRSLDIRDNRITDTAVRTLLSTCFHHSSSIPAFQRHQDRSLSGVAQDDWPSGVPRHDFHIMDEFRGDDIDERFVRRLTRGVVSRLPSEDLPHAGITHLYIANNFVSVEGLASLVKSKSLHVLDAGTLDTAKSVGRPRTRSSVSRLLEVSDLLPGLEKLTPFLERCASDNLTSLRIHHSVVTEAFLLKDDIPSPCELPPEQAARPELGNLQAGRYEMDDTAPVYELPDGYTTPRNELPGDPMHFIISPAVDNAHGRSFETQENHEIKWEPVFAPEVDLSKMASDFVDDEEPVILSATGLGPMAQAVNGISGPFKKAPTNTSLPEEAGSSSATNSTNDSSRRIRILEEKRRELRARNPDLPRGLIPGAIPSLQTLVLTDVPLIDKDGRVVDSLKSFIVKCAEEAHLAAVQASLENANTHIAGRPRSAHHLYRTKELFALQRIVLEMAAEKSAPSSVVEGSLSPRTPTFSGWKHQRHSSSIGDPDTAAFWAAAENDFSFFGEEECGLPADEPGMHFPMSSLSEKMVLPMESLQSSQLPTLQQPDAMKPTGVDVVQALAEYRKKRKTAYENAVNMGVKYVDGYWPGEVKVVRHQSGSGSTKGNVDCYGNYFEKGVYR